MTEFKPRTVFLSYTSRFSRFPEGESFVAAAENAIARAGDAICHMGHFAARPNPPAEKCRREVKRCEIYVGVFGPFFGSAPEDDPDLSYTMLEYETARREGKKMFIYLLSSRFSWPIDDGRECDAKFQKQQAFLEEVRAAKNLYTYEEFATPDALARSLLFALLEHKYTELLASFSDEPSPAAVRTAEVEDDGNRQASGELPTKFRDLIVASCKEHSTALSIAEWAVELAGLDQVANFYLSLFADREAPMNVRLIIPGVLVNLMKPQAEKMNYQDWVIATDEAEGTGTTSQALQLFCLVSKGHKATDPEFASFVERLLVVLHGKSGLLQLSAARALYALSGFSDDVSRFWKPPTEDQAIVAGISKILSAPELDPMLVRYLLFILSRCRDMSLDTDILYELAYGIDNGVNPMKQIETQTSILPEELAEVLQSYLGSLEREVRIAAAFSSARYRVRDARLVKIFAEFFENYDEASGDYMFDEACAFLCWLGDISSITALIKSEAKCPTRPAATLALAWLIYRNKVDAAVELKWRHTLRERVQGICKNLKKSARNSKSADEEIRWMNSPSGRTYDEIGKETEELSRSRQYLLYLTKSTERPSGRDAWWYVWVSLPALDRFLLLVRTVGTRLTDHGRIVASGWGEAPTQEQIDDIFQRLGVDI